MTRKHTLPVNLRGKPTHIRNGDTLPKDAPSAKPSGLLLGLLGGLSSMELAKAQSQALRSKGESSNDLKS